MRRDISFLPFDHTQIFLLLTLLILFWTNNSSAAGDLTTMLRFQQLDMQAGAEPKTVNDDYPSLESLHALYQPYVVNFSVYESLYFIYCRIRDTGFCKSLFS